MAKPSNTVSYSRLGVYLDCPELYRQRYIVKSKDAPTPPLEQALIRGVLAHSCIEEYLNGMEKDVAISMALQSWLKDICHINPEYDKENNLFKEATVDVEDLELYSKECGKLLARCSADYLKEDKIRNKDGTAPKDPLEYPPTTFKQEFRALGLDQLQFSIDNTAVRANNSFKRFSLANTAAQAVSYIYIFNLPAYVEKVKAVELNLSYKKVPFRDGRYYWNGVIDTEYITNEGEIIVNDHKTEKAVRRPEDVAFDLQLNSYAAIRCEQTDHLPDYISITHLGTNRLIAAKTDPTIVNQAMDYLEAIQADIDRLIDTVPEGQPWLKKWPSKYGSPCLRRHWKTGNLETACPYIKTCWPDYYNCIKDEVDEFFGNYDNEDTQSRDPLTVSAIACP